VELTLTERLRQATAAMAGAQVGWDRADPHREAETGHRIHGRGTGRVG
jgi:hypothetical protein